MPSSSISLLRAVAVIGFLPLLAACDDHAASATAKAERPVQVQRVAFENENATREFVGVVRARYETDLGFRVAGKMVSRVVNVGDRVQVGDVVARLDPQDLKLQVESAEAEFAAATSSLQQTASDLERYTTLKARGWASIADFDRKKAAKDEAEGRLERAKRSLDLAHNQLDYSDLKADADGVITATLAEPGQVVAIGQPVVRLAHRGEKEAVVALPETWLTEARSSKATVQLWSGPGRNFAARLRELSPQADVATRTYAARFTIENPDNSVALGMTATVTLSHSADARWRSCRSRRSSTVGPAHRSMWSTSPASSSCGRSRLRPSPRTRRLSPPASPMATGSSSSACRSSTPGKGYARSMSAKE